MVKVKFIKAVNDYEKYYVGEVLEAFRVDAGLGDECVQYMVSTGNGCMLVDTEQCEVVEQSSIAEEVKTQIKKQVLQELSAGAIAKMKQRPKDLYFKDALYEYFMELDKEMKHD